MPGIQEDKIPMSEPEDKVRVHIIHDEGESGRQNENPEKSPELTYHKKYANTDTSSYVGVLNALKKLDTLYNPNMSRMHEPVIEGNYKVTGDTRVIPIVESEEEKVSLFLQTLDNLRPSMKQ